MTKRIVNFMKRAALIYGVMFLSLFIFSSLSLAQHGGHGGMGSSPMKMETREVLVEGVKMTFQIMANEEHKKMLKDMKMKEMLNRTTHNIGHAQRPEEPEGDHRCSDDRGGRSEGRMNQRTGNMKYDGKL
jgi:hypothetical protein